jgi:hypothetical protein
MEPKQCLEGNIVLNVNTRKEERFIINNLYLLLKNLENKKQIRIKIEVLK